MHPFYKTCKLTQTIFFSCSASTSRAWRSALSTSRRTTVGASWCVRRIVPLPRTPSSAPPCPGSGKRRAGVRRVLHCCRTGATGRRAATCTVDQLTATDRLPCVPVCSASLARYRTDRSRVAVDFGDGVGESVGGGPEWRQGDPCEELYPRCLQHDLPPVLGGPERPSRPPTPVYLEHDSYAAHQHHHHHHRGHYAEHVVEPWHGHSAGPLGAPGPPSSLGALPPSDHRHNEYVYEYPQPLGADYATSTTSGAHNTDAQLTQALIADGPGHDAVLSDEDASTASATVLSPLRMDTTATKNPDVVPTAGAVPSATSNLDGLSLSSSSTLPAVPPGPVGPAGTTGKSALSGMPETTRKRWGPEGQVPLEHRHRDLQPQVATGAVDREDRGARGRGSTPSPALPPNGVSNTPRFATVPSLGPLEPALNITVAPNIWRRVLFHSDDRIKIHRD